MYLTVDLTIVQLTFNTKSLIRKVNTKSCGYDKIYMDKDLIEDLLYQMVDQSNERKLMIEIFILHYLTISIRFIMEVAELVRYCLFIRSFLSFKFDRCK